MFCLKLAVIACGGSTKMSADSKSSIERTHCLQYSTLNYSSWKHEELLGQNLFKLSHLFSQNTYFKPEVHILSSKLPLTSVRTCLSKN